MHGVNRFDRPVHFLRCPYGSVAAVSIRPMAERFLIARCQEAFRSQNGYTGRERDSRYGHNTFVRRSYG